MLIQEVNRSLFLDSYEIHFVGKVWRFGVLNHVTISYHCALSSVPGV
jgi:hypothetical protein